MKYFVSSDIHGFFDEWMLALKNSNFDINNPEHKIIVCGDLFDRGRQPKQIIDFILSHRDKITVIRGNHEDLMQAMIDRNKNNSMDLSNGTAQTIVDLCPEWLISKFDLTEIAKETGLQEVLDLCVDYFETNKVKDLTILGWIIFNLKIFKYKKLKFWKMKNNLITLFFAKMLDFLILLVYIKINERFDKSSFG